MPGHDDHDLERRLRDERSEPDAQFVQRVAATVSGNRHPTARPRLTLAFALTVALLVSMIAFGGVGAAKNAISSSTSAVRSAMGESSGKHFKHGNKWPWHHQYKTKVSICLPKYKWVGHWKWEWRWSKDHKHHVKVLVYVTRRVPLRSVPFLVSKGAVYPVPAGGCSSLNQKPTDNSTTTST